MSTAIVIPTWNNDQTLMRCLYSIRTLTIADYRAIIVDNGSTDNTPRFLADFCREDKRFGTIRLDSNLGFIGGTNRGMQDVRENENVLMLNDDTQIVDPTWLYQLESDLIRYAKVGAVAPVSNAVSGIQDFRLSVATNKQEHLAKYLIGFCLLIRGEAFRQVGLLDERFGANQFDDLDYSLRLREKGWGLMVDRRVFVYHYFAQTTQRTPADREKLQARLNEGKRLLMDKWGEDRVQELFVPPAGVFDA